MVEVPEKVTVGEKFSIVVTLKQQSDTLAVAKDLQLTKGSGPGAVTGDGNTYSTVAGTVTISDLIVDAAGDYTLNLDCTAGQCGTPINSVSATIKAELNSYIIYTLPSYPVVF